MCAGVDVEGDEDQDDPDSRTNQREADARTRPSNDYGPDANDIKHRGAMQRHAYAV
jgi:hypothetical protein